MLRQGEPFILGALGAGVGRAGGGGADGWMFDCGGRRIESMFRHGAGSYTHLTLPTTSRV
ncbi:hypothetical protein JBE04_45295, partial [Streptomyces sp. PRKS01-29]|nr:hypothetical protein [Streptomyces sabulosicollis]